MTDPLTNVCIVADIYRCPPNYELVIAHIYLENLMYLHHRVI